MPIKLYPMHAKICAFWTIQDNWSHPSLQSKLNIQNDFLVFGKINIFILFGRCCVTRVCSRLITRGRVWCGSTWPREARSLPLTVTSPTGTLWPMPLNWNTFWMSCKVNYCIYIERFFWKYLQVLNFCKYIYAFGWKVCLLSKLTWHWVILMSECEVWFYKLTNTCVRYWIYMHQNIFFFNWRGVGEGELPQQKQNGL